jgi:hypothetical protein
VIELPERFLPGKYRVFWRVITNGVIPGLFTLLLCVGLYRLLVVPLNHLREQANAWRADQLNVRLSSRTTNRPDELGELGSGIRSHVRTPANHRGVATAITARPVPRTAHAAEPIAGGQ